MQEKNRDAYGIAALVIGLIGFLFTFVLIGGPIVGLIAAVVAILLGTVSINRIGQNPVARVGRILGIIGVVVVVVYMILLIIVMRMGA